MGGLASGRGVPGEEVAMLRHAKGMAGFVLSGAEGDVGVIEDVLLDVDYWVIRYFLVATGSWNAGRRILVSTAALSETDWERRRFETGLTRESIRRAPDVDPRLPLSRRKEEEISLHFGWPAYWEVNRYPEYPGMGEPRYPEIRKKEYAGAARGYFSSSNEERRRREAGAETAGGAGFHVHGARRIIGARIRATDGDAGHVSDLLVSDDFWLIRCLVADTRAFFPGKHILILPRMILRVDWDELVLYITVRRDVVLLAPEYDPDRELPLDSEDKLYDYYAHHTY